MGYSTTNISIFSKGVYINNCLLDIGGLDIDREIIKTYNVNKKNAILLKENLVNASLSNVKVREVMELEDLDNQLIKVNQQEISVLVNKKLEEMLNLIKKKINLLTKKEISYIIITGGLSEFNDITKLYQKVFGNKSKIGHINEIGARDNSYSTSLGMIKYFNSKLELRGKLYSCVSDNDIELMINSNGKLNGNDDSIIGRVFSYFFDN